MTIECPFVVVYGCIHSVCVCFHFVCDVCGSYSGSYTGLIGVLMSLRKVCNHPDLFEVCEMCFFMECMTSFLFLSATLSAA